MTNPFLVTFDNNIISIILLTLLLFNIILRKQHITYSNRLFIFLILSTIAVLILEVLSWAVDRKFGFESRSWNILINNLLFFTGIMVPVSWLNYLDYQVHKSISRLRKRFFYLFYLIPVLVVLIWNLRSGWLFSISEENYFVRGIGMIYDPLYIFLIIFTSAFFIVKEWHHLEKNVIYAFTIFTLLPVAGAVLQMLLPGIPLVWNSVSMGVVIIYIFLELRNYTRDYLTGLLTRQQIEEWISFRLSRMNRSSTGMALIMLDLDRFKSINDEYGHNEGDQALITFSNILIQSVKNRDRVARFAGDEFIILLEASDEQIILQIQERIKRKLDLFNNRKIKPYTISCSCGGVLYNKNKHTSLSHFLDEADQLMYEEKMRKRQLEA